MSEVTIVKLNSQLVPDMCRTGAYREASVMLPRVWEFALSKNVLITGFPVFL